VKDCLKDWLGDAGVQVQSYVDYRPHKFAHYPTERIPRLTLREHIIVRLREQKIHCGFRDAKHPGSWRQGIGLGRVC
jgi:hypothetical protein